MQSDEHAAATAVLDDVTHTVMRSKPWDTFCGAVNDQVSKYLRQDNVEVGFHSCLIGGCREGG